MGRNKYIPCEVCLQSFRSDKIRAHLKQHGVGSKYPMKTCPVCQKTMIARHLPRHQKVHKKLENDILRNIKADQSNFNYNYYFPVCTTRTETISPLHNEIVQLTHFLQVF